MKKAFLLLAFIASSLLKSQSCSSPISVSSNGSWRGVDSFNIAERSHIFNATDGFGRIKINVNNYSSATFTLDVFNNNCSLLISLTPTITSAGDSIFVELPQLTPSDNYLIKLGNGTGTYLVYDLAVSTPSNPNVPLTGCTSGNCGYPNTVCGELVCNGGFECTTGSVTTEGQISTGTANNWTGVNMTSPDLFSGAALTPTFGVPCNGMGNASAYNSPNNNYAGIIVHSSPANFNEYLQTKLISPLQANKSYHISFYVRRAQRSQALVNSLSVFFEQNQYYSPSYVCTLNPKATVSNTTVLNSFGSWERISFCYTPTQSGEQYLIIGSGTQLQTGGYSTGSPGSCTVTANVNYTTVAYLYIDDVSVLAVEDMLNVTSQTICPGAPTLVNGLNCVLPFYPYTMSWNPTTGVSNPGVPTTTITTNSNQTYTNTLNLITASGQTCSATAQLPLFVYPDGVILMLSLRKL